MQGVLRAIPLGFAIVVSLLFALFGGPVARSFAVAWGFMFALWTIYGVIWFGSYALVRYLRSFMLAGGVVVAFLIIRGK